MGSLGARKGDYVLVGDVVYMNIKNDEHGTFHLGSDTLTGVNDADYKPPFPFTGKLNKLTLKVDRPQLSAADIKKLEAGMKKVEAGKE